MEKGREGSVPTDVLKRSILTEEELSQLPQVCVCLIGKFKAVSDEHHHSVVLAVK